MAVAVLGIRGTGSFGTAEEPLNWRQQILYQFPNGEAPLTALLSKIRSEGTNDPTFNWFEKTLPVQRGMILGASNTLSGAPTSGVGITGGSSIYMALTIVPDGQLQPPGPTNDVSMIKVGHTIYNQVGDELYLVTKVDAAGGFIIVQRNIGGRNPATFPNVGAGTGTPLANGDTLFIAGSAFPEGAAVGTAIAYPPAKYSNYTQIFRTPAYFTRTARKTALRWDTSGPYYDGIREALREHSIEMEKAFWWGEKQLITPAMAGFAGANYDTTAGMTITTNTPARFTRGIVRWLPTVTTTSVSVHTDLTQFSGGVITETIWDQFCEEAFRYGSREKVAFAGSTAINNLTQMAKNKSTIETVPTDQTYGMHMVKYLTPFGALYIVNHPLFSNDPVWRKDLCIVDFDKVNFRYITDTKLRKNVQNPGQDASIDEFLTEAGLEVHFSGLTTMDADSPSQIPTPAAHARLKGIAQYGG